MPDIWKRPTGSSVSVSDPSPAPIRSVAWSAHRVPGRQRRSWWRSSVRRMRRSGGASSSMTGSDGPASTGTTAPLRSHARPSDSSLTAACTHTSSKLTGVHSHQNWGAARVERATFRARRHAADAPAAVPAPPPPTGSDGGDLAVDPVPARPLAPLREPGEVEDGAGPLGALVPGLLERGGAGAERDVGLEAVLGALDDHPETAQRLDHVDGDRSDRGLGSGRAGRGPTRAPTAARRRGRRENAASITWRFG